MRTSCLLSAAFSLCPNDIFLFRSFLRKEPSFDIFSETLLTDIDMLNHLATQQAFPLLKISAAHYPSVASHYTMLPVGAAIGFSCGPLLIKNNDYPLSAIRSVAVPGLHTTAAALVKIFYPSLQLIPIPYNQILAAIQDHQVDTGVIIHESRFSYDTNTFSLIEDLGARWEQETSLPLPLGCLVIDKKVPENIQISITKLLQQSLQRSLYEHYEDAVTLSLTYAQEDCPSIIQRFIHTYVSSESLQLSTLGEKAFHTLWNRLLLRV